MVYKNLKHNYLIRLFDSFIFKKEKNSNKFIFIFKLPEDFTLAQKQNLSRVLNKNGINIRQIKTKFFPNPVKDFLHLNSTIPIRIIEVFNSVGQLIFRYEPRKNYLDIDMSLLLDGMYTIKIITENGIQNLLILKNS